jgi:DNA-damage-inducible protein J
MAAARNARPKTALKTEFVRARIDRRTKLEAEAVLGAVGLTLSEAFRLMLSRVVADRRLPFDPLVPNEETIAALRADLAGDVIHVGDPANLFAVLDAD